MKHLLQKNISQKSSFMNLKSAKIQVYWIISFLFLFVVTSILLLMSTSTVAQEGRTITGRLIDTVGNPISDVVMYVRPYKEPVQSGPINIVDESVQIATDSKGRFAFSNIHHQAIDFDIDGSSKIGFEINVLSIECGEIALYPDRGWHWSSVDFALDPGTKMEDIVVTADIQKRPKLTTRVVYADGTPVANSKVYILRESKSFFTNAKGDGRGSMITDEEGYFVKYFSGIYPPQYYVTLAVEHQGLYAKATPFVLIDDVDIVLKLNGNPGVRTNPTISYSERYSALEVFLEPSPMWVANQTNGHAYKITKSQTIKDALKQADAEGAYLLSINDRAEEVWLSHIYGNESIWIGLSDTEEEGKWKWHSGEPVDYTNWLPYQPKKGNTETKDYVKTGYFDWGWEVYGEEHKRFGTDDSAPIYGRAILEKPSIQLTSQLDEN